MTSSIAQTPDSLISNNDDDSDLDEDELYIPSISDQLHAGFCRMDRACQTTITEIVDLKELSKVLRMLMADLDSVQKTFYYAKLLLQSEYDGRLKEAVIELYRRVNHRVLEIENAHKKHITVVRRSYKTQLANALAKLAQDYRCYYGIKDALNDESNSEKLKELEAQQKMQRMNELAQQEMFAMLQLQMEEAKAKAVEVPSRAESVVSTSGFVKEIDNLRETVKEYESRMDYLEDMLEETNADNSRLNSELEELAEKLTQQETKNSSLTGQIDFLKDKIAKEKMIAEEKLVLQREELKAEMAQKIKEVRHKMSSQAQKEMDDLRQTEAQKLRKQKQEEEKKLKDLEMQREVNNKPVEVIVDSDTERLQLIEKKQRAEIARLQRELDRTTKMWEMKVKVLQEQIHSLKDEMHLRTTLKRQAASMKHATLTYVKQGNDLVPCGFAPTPSFNRSYQLPKIIQAPKVNNEIAEVQQQQQQDYSVVTPN